MHTQMQKDRINQKVQPSVFFEPPNVKKQHFLKKANIILQNSQNQGPTMTPNTRDQSRYHALSKVPPRGRQKPQPPKTGLSSASSSPLSDLKFDYSSKKCKKNKHESLIERSLTSQETRTFSQRFVLSPIVFTLKELKRK